MAESEKLHRKIPNIAAWRVGHCRDLAPSCRKASKMVSVAPTYACEAPTTLNSNAVTLAADQANLETRSACFIDQQIAKLLAKDIFADLPGGITRDFLHDFTSVGDPSFRDLSIIEFTHRVDGYRFALLWHDNKKRSLIPFWVSRSDHRRIGNRGMTECQVLQIHRGNPLPA